MRDPSLHIKRSDLIKVLDKFEWQAGLSTRYIADEILKRAKTYSPSNRLIVESDKQTEKKVSFIEKASRENAAAMARIIFLTRKKLRHKGVELIKPATKDWSIIKSITENADKFCRDFDLTYGPGYIAYVETGISFMQKFRLPSLASMYSSISERYDAIMKMAEDKYPDKTKQAHDYYRIFISKHTGVINTYERIPEKYVFFIKVVEEARAFGVPVKTYLNAQLEYFIEQLGTVPTPEQLVSEKAKIRLNTYLMKR